MSVAASPAIAVCRAANVPKTTTVSRAHNNAFAEKLIAFSFAVDTALCLLLAIFAADRLDVALPISASPWAYPIGVTTMYLAALAYCGVYNPRHLLNWPHAVRAIVNGGGLVTLILLGLNLLLQSRVGNIDPVGAIATASVPMVLALWRWRFTGVLQVEKYASRLRQRTIVIGWTTQAAKLSRVLWEIQNEPTELVGAVSVNEIAPEAHKLPNVPHLGSVSDLTAVIEHERISTALLVDVTVGDEMLQHIASVCEKQLVEFKIVPSWFSVLLSGLHVESLAGIPVLGVTRLPLQQFANRLTKRLIDIAGAAVGLVLSAPLIALFAILVYRESPGPVLYRQRRLGRDGHVFEILKIRSMRIDAEKEGQVGWSRPNDERRLKIGAFMRRWNIDELPQFWNVLKGEMSLVGPRPERPELIATFKHDIDHYNLRHFVKPGITGWAQVNGLRGDTDLRERINHDLYYVEHWSVAFDLQTMLLTFLRNKNAC